MRAWHTTLLRGHTARATTRASFGWTRTSEQLGGSLKMCFFTFFDNSHLTVHTHRTDPLFTETEYSLKVSATEEISTKGVYSIVDGGYHHWVTMMSAGAPCRSTHWKRLQVPFTSGEARHEFSRASAWKECALDAKLDPVFPLPALRTQLACYEISKREWATRYLDSSHTSVAQASPSRQPFPYRFEQWR